MAKYGPSSVGSFIANGRSLAGTLTQITFKKIGATENTDALGDSWQESTPTGRLSGELYQTGWFDDAANSSVAAFVGSETTSQVVTINPAGSAAGSAVTGFEGAFGAEVERLIEKEGLHKLNVTYNVSGAIDDGKVVEALGAQTATGNSASLDNLAATTDGGAGYIQVTAVSGTSPTGDMIIQHSADDTSFANLVTFTQATAITAERIAVSGTVNRYLRVARTIGGSSTPTITYMVAFARG